jgi:hypothetical protein
MWLTAAGSNGLLWNSAQGVQYKLGWSGTLVATN